MRLQRYLAQAGIASRRKAEELIVAGSVRVNGTIVRELGTTVDETKDRVEYAGRVVALAAEHTYIVLHKPFGVVTTMSDPEGRRTVADVVRAHGVQQRVVPVGRLDYDTAGILLLTDDGDLAHVLTHPRFGVEKTYRATVRGRLTAEHVAEVNAGVKLDDGRAAPAVLRVIAMRRQRSVIDITIHEGRNRQVRKMFEALGHPVVDLVRMRFGPLSLGELAPGDMREATEREIKELRVVLQQAREEA
ncbi:MAG: 23S rRNA pseudouridine(2605) synthase RluB [Candidatus Velthaea sp.]